MDPKEFVIATKELGKEFVKSLKPISDKIGVGADHIYKLTVKKIYTEAVLGLIVFSLIALFVNVLCYLAIMNNSTNHREFLNFVGWFVLIVGWPTFLYISAEEFVKKLINSEFYALEQIIRILKGR